MTSPMQRSHAFNPTHTHTHLDSLLYAWLTWLLTSSPESSFRAPRDEVLVPGHLPRTLDRAGEHAAQQGQADLAIRPLQRYFACSALPSLYDVVVTALSISVIDRLPSRIM